MAFQQYVLECEEKQFCSEVSNNIDLNNRSPEQYDNEQCDLYKDTITNQSYP